MDIVRGSRHGLELRFVAGFRGGEHTRLFMREHRVDLPDQRFSGRTLHGHE